jgi:hypothetical protein
MHAVAVASQAIAFAADNRSSMADKVGLEAGIQADLEEVAAHIMVVVLEVATVEGWDVTVDRQAVEGL